MTKEIIEEDFKTMQGMLDMIKEKIQKVPLEKQFQFYNPIKNMIFEAWKDATNPNDEFLFPHANKLKAV